MKFILLSDIHATSKNPIARKDDILKTFIKKMTFVLKYAEEHNAIILQAGDFFDRPRDWLLLYLMIHLLDKYPSTRIFTIYGQHDLYLYSNPADSPTTMSILCKSKYFNQLKRKPLKIKQNWIYGCDWGRKVPKPKGGKNILVIHAPIAAKELFPKHGFTSSAYFTKENKGYDLILCGDIHRLMFHTNKRSIVLNTGPMLRLDGSKYNFRHKPAFYIWNSKTSIIKRVEIPHTRAKEVLTRDHIERKKDFNNALNTFVKSIHGSKIDFVSIKDTIKQLVLTTKADKRVKSFLAEVMTDDN